MNPNLLRSIPPAKLRIILELMEASRGQGTDSVMPLLMQANQKMQQQGLQFTPAESQLILDMLKEDMTPEEIRRLEMMQSILANFHS